MRVRYYHYNYLKELKIVMFHVLLPFQNKKGPDSLSLIVLLCNFSLSSQEFVQSSLGSSDQVHFYAAASEKPFVHHPQIHLRADLQ